MILRIVLFLVITVFYIAYFYKQIELKQKGIKTNRLAKGSKPKSTKMIERVLLICTYGTAVVQYLSVFISHYMFPIYVPDIMKIVGLVIATFGVGIFIISIITMRDNWRAGVDEEQSTKIVTNGIYKYSRNPAFVGFDLMYIGTALAVPNLVISIFVLLTVIFLHLQILEEEKHLPTVFGEDYLNYKKSTPRYLFL